MRVKIRNPKSEGRKKAEIRSPKALPHAAFADHASRITHLSRRLVAPKRPRDGGSQTQPDRAKAEAIALILATTNSFNYDLFVSQAYKNSAGYDPGAAPNATGANFTNVNYDYTDPKSGSRPLSSGEMLQNIANLYIDPMPP